uniref:CSON006553 protein n=1 Tax=Culicoides sonorensis TaxID=179676 RepID=A0A336L9I2_CULSO
MLPYSAVAMDYANYQRHAAGPPVTSGTIGMSIGGPPSFTHSWLVPSQDLCGMAQYKTNAPTLQQPPIDSGHVILEQRKEKSRDAARSRRGKENYEFYELAKMLPLPAAITSQLDKASIIRLTISYLKLRDFSSQGDPPWNREQSSASKILKTASNRRNAAGLALEMFESHQGTHILQSLDGFALSVAADGRFLYISETVSIYLGLSQVEMTGSSIFDYVHVADHAEIAEQLGLSLSTSVGMASPASGHSEESSSHGTNNPDVSSIMNLTSSMYKGYDRAFCIRMKSTLTKRGCHFKSSGYRVVLILCRLRPQYTFSHNKKQLPPLLGMVGLAIALPPPSVHEIRLDCDMFVSRINFDFKIVHCEPKVQDLLDYSSDELIGRNLYTLCHGEEIHKLRKSHLDLINKGQVLTHYYRVMNKHGGYTWIQTCATVVCNSKNAEEQNIICVNYIVSGKENCNLVLDCCQYEPVKQEDKEAALAKENSSKTRETPTPDANNTSSNNKTVIGNKASQKEVIQPEGSRTRLKSNESKTMLVANEDETNIDEPPPKPPSTRGRKRKNKNQQETKEIDSTPVEPVAKISRVCHEEKPDGSTVKTLENAMSKHLTQQNTTTDFSTDALLNKQQETKPLSPVHWSGHNSHFYQPTPVPATALLQQLYANRESVIRATARPSPNDTMYPDYSHPNSLTMPTAISIVNGDPSAYHHDPQYSHHHTTAHLVSSYGTYPTTTTTDYHVQSAMTPPSSVSPRDNNTTISHNSYSHCSHNSGETNDGSPNANNHTGIGIRCNRSL